MLKNGCGVLCLQSYLEAPNIVQSNGIRAVICGFGIHSFPDCKFSNDQTLQRDLLTPTVKIGYGRQTTHSINKNAAYH
jgi:hypothetical protein